MDSQAFSKSLSLCRLGLGPSSRLGLWPSIDLSLDQLKVDVRFFNKALPYLNVSEETLWPQGLKLVDGSTYIAI